ncbi:MAG: hypothetical protein DIJKHBIC_04164 [Thermoanaerobaculia bacterium]|nr:hypothetical protein [Thermoanaerobaculia bacterium]
MDETDDSPSESEREVFAAESRSHLSRKAWRESLSRGERAAVDIIDLVNEMRDVLKGMELTGAPLEVLGVYVLSHFEEIEVATWRLRDGVFGRHQRGRSPDPERLAWVHAWQALTREISTGGASIVSESPAMHFVNLEPFEVQIQPLLELQGTEGTSISFGARAARARRMKGSHRRRRAAERLAAEYLLTFYPASKTQRWLGDITRDDTEEDTTARERAAFRSQRRQGHRRVHRVRHSP